MVELLAVIGALIVIASAMVTGWRLERFALRTGLWIPRDSGAALGFAIGVLCVARWLT